MPPKKHAAGTRVSPNGEKRVSPNGRKLFTLYRSKNPTKKFDIFLPGTRANTVRKVSFGGAGYSDYTVHKDKARRERYRTRHAGDHIRDPYSAGFWSWYVLWGDSSNLALALRAAVARARALLKGR